MMLMLMLMPELVLVLTSETGLLAMTLKLSIPTLKTVHYHHWLDK